MESQHTAQRHGGRSTLNFIIPFDKRRGGKIKIGTTMAWRARLKNWRKKRKIVMMIDHVCVSVPQLCYAISSI